MFEDLVSSNTQNSIDYNDTKTDFILANADSILLDEDDVTVGVKHHNGRNILAVERSTDIGFTVVLTGMSYTKLRKKFCSLMCRNLFMGLLANARTYARYMGREGGG